jgi:hypothetical protein
MSVVDQGEPSSSITTEMAPVLFLPDWSNFTFCFQLRHLRIWAFLEDLVPAPFIDFAIKPQLTVQALVLSSLPLSAVVFESIWWPWSQR